MNVINDFRKTGKYTNFLNHLKKGTPLEKEIVGYIELLESQILTLEMMLKSMEDDKK